MPKVLLETKGIKQYFPTGKRRNEKKNLKRLSEKAVKIYKNDYPTENPQLKEKDLLNLILEQFKEGKKFSDELNATLTEYEARSNVHGERLYVRANDGIDLAIFEGETVGLVGESGCGKSTLGRTILKLYEPTEGEIFFNGEDITKYSSNKMMPLRREMQIIFQDPYSALNPRMTVGEIIGEALLEHGVFKSRNDDFENYVKEIMKTCGLEDYMIYRYPHEFSGGQRQRIGIARALALKPKFIVCDEAVSALDVSIQSQIINLLKDLQKEFGLAYLFISHDLSVVKHISDRIGVMYLGDMVEFSDKDSLYENPLHPYTKALLSAIPETDLQKSRSKKKIILEGDIPSNVIVPTGCKFHTRCPIAKNICKRDIPEFREVEKGHFVACHFSGAEI
ncbi:ABC transporter ATP-binding protein [Alkaliphilus hydrothermalis]|uniref:Peptide/nickel transport system ATP-binding protein/oligopeptide transport system ATP-binding protein n=1 Tax=Alkaliphilus hydrothermalis TaxID=1482730 RepID=A0ABS2NNV5_9FIRM|nr:oligopeptide/dipeptide ABC transporter ATP-binding protein [Alkaliphilus hydrothermalis]MBM7614617.1 peptide/nickel transport system ATP-binding protein/oligopeptide transport system ATP-binding protein [Alkaliphilus hydrothermalis]